MSSHVPGGYAIVYYVQKGAKELLSKEQKENVTCLVVVVGSRGIWNIFIFRNVVGYRYRVPRVLRTR